MAAVVHRRRRAPHRGADFVTGSLISKGIHRGTGLANQAAMRVLVVDETAERAELLRAALTLAGHEVTASLSSPLALLKTIERLQPDVIVIDTDSPSRDVLEHLVMISQHTPRPVVMFTSDGSPEAIRAAARAGVAAYVVDGMDEARIKTIVDVAVARFEERQDLRGQLAEANSKLAERKLIERAKGLLMKSRNLDEEAAYSALRKAAMDRNLKLSEIAQRIVDAADLLGA
jgi:two-component system, response regulator / RNA-binding antiterminator